MKTLHVQYIVHAIYCSKTGYRISELLSDWRTAVVYRQEIVFRKHAFRQRVLTIC